MSHLKWAILITIVIALLAALISVGGGVVGFIEHYFSYEDNSFRPMDIERRIYELERYGKPKQNRSTLPDESRQP